jgi:6-pyruvoyltetrahydropterin/6-carboxytetrahydropterin synthase
MAVTNVSCTRKISWCAGHRVLNHEGKCAHPHGHQYTAEITAVSADGLDRLGRVVDFGVLKEVYQTWVDKWWDHGFIINEEDSELRDALQAIEGSKVYELQGNPTAENLALFLLEYRKFRDDLALSGVKVAKVVVWETPNCCAEASVEDCDE